MGVFGGLILTNRGRNLQVKAQTGVQLNFTRMAMGDGSLGSSSILELNKLKSEKLSLPLTKLKAITNGQAVLGSVLKNQDIVAGFYFRELGIFATDPDLGEILYCYGNAGNLADYIPAGGEGSTDLLEKTIDVNVLVGNATNVTATINQSLIFETPEGAQEKAKAAEANAINFATQEVNLVNETVARHLADYVKHPAVGKTKNVGNSYTVDLGTGVSEYTHNMGLVLTFNADSTNTSTNISLAIAGLPPKVVLNSKGKYATGFKKDSIYTLRYNAEAYNPALFSGYGAFILQGEGGSGNLQPNQALAGFTFTNDDGEQVGVGDPDLIPSNIKSGVNIFGVNGTLPVGFQPGDNVQVGFFTYSNRYSVGSTPVRLAEVKLGVAGTYRVICAIRLPGGTHTTYTQLYVNGQPRGVLKSYPAMNGLTNISEDIFLDANENVQFYAWSSVPAAGYGISIDSIGFTIYAPITRLY